MRAFIISTSMLLAFATVSCNNKPDEGESAPESLNWKMDASGDSTVQIDNVTIKKLSYKRATDMISNYRSSTVVILDPEDQSGENDRSTLWSEFSQDYISRIVNVLMKPGDRFFVVTGAYIKDDNTSYPQNPVKMNEPTLMIRILSTQGFSNYYTADVKSELCPIPTDCP